MGIVALKAENTRAVAPMESDLLEAADLVEAVAPGFSIRIHNLDEIARAYGPEAALAASDHVRAFLNHQLRGRESLGLAEYVLRQLSENPVAYDGQRFHLFVSLAPTGDTKGCATKAMPTVHGNPAFPDDAWCRHYRADMALAVNLLLLVAVATVGGCACWWSLRRTPSLPRGSMSRSPKPPRCLLSPRRWSWCRCFGGTAAIS